MDDALKQARADLLARRILRQVMSLATTERQIIRVDDHRRTLGAVALVMDAFLGQLPERLGAQVGAADLVLHELGRATHEMRVSLAGQVESITTPPASPAQVVAL